MKTLRLLLTLLLVSLLCACGGGGSGGGGDEPAATPDRYEVRGVVKEVGGEGADARATIQHEAIPTFKDREGNATGMKAMTMAFGVDDAVDRSVLSQGAKVEFVIEVDWEKRPALMIKQARPLPPETELQL